MKKILATLLTTTLVLGAGFLPAEEGSVNFGGSDVIIASAEEVSGDYEYEIKSDGTVEITEYIGEGENVIIPSILDGKNVTSIGNAAFYCCDSLTSITIPASITSIGDSVFGGCSSLISITVDNNNNNYVSKDGILFDKDITKLIAYPCRSSRNSYSIPNSVTSIEDHAFHGCADLTSITIPDSVTSIGDFAFEDCYNLLGITIPDSVTSIGYCAFTCCYSLISITIPDSVVSIEDCAFESCESLPSITIPNSVTCIEYRVFSDCESLTSITIPANVTSIEADAFFDCPVENVYYTGTKSQWNTIDIDQDGNDCLRNATLHCADGSHTHAYTSKKTTMPTCTEPGVKTYTCSCGYTYTESIPSTNHHYVKVTVKPTLTETGYTGEKCSVCGTIRNKKNIAKLLNISKVKVTGLTSKTYTGGKINPSFKVYYGKTLLKNGKDYTIKSGTNKFVGKGTVTISGKGKYGGKITKTFSILPRSTSISAKSTKRGKLNFTVTKRSEATKYQIQYATNSKFKSAKTLTTTSLKPVVSASSKKTYYVRVRTVKKAGKTNYYSKWSSVKKIKVK